MSCIPFCTRQMRTTLLLRPNGLFWMNRFRFPAQALAFVNDCLVTHGFYQVTAQQVGRKRSVLAAFCVGEGGWVRFRKGLPSWQSDLVIPQPGTSTDLSSACTVCFKSTPNPLEASSETIPVPRLVLPEQHQRPCYRRGSLGGCRPSPRTRPNRSTIL